MSTHVRDIALRARAAAARLALATTGEKNAALLGMADSLCSAQDTLLHANAHDVSAAQDRGTPATMVDRLTLTPARIASMAEGLRQVAALQDPIGEVLDGWRRPNGLDIQRVRVPLGVVGIIYESRPNVTA